jgi:hypothetical protein
MIIILLLDGADAKDAQGNTIASTGDTLEGGSGSDQYVFGRGDGEAVIYDEATGAIAGTLVNGATDSFAGRIAGITAGTVARNWAGNGDYTVDGSVKGGEDAIVFRAGLTMNDLVIERSGTTGTPGQDLIIRLVTKVAVPVSTLYPNGLRTDLTGDRLVIRDWFESTRRIEWLRKFGINNKSIITVLRLCAANDNIDFATWGKVA